MKAIVKYGYILTSIIFLLYLLTPGLKFPDKPEDALLSDEPADTESAERRAYFTNMSRNEVMDYYTGKMKNKMIPDINIPTYRLNYPPEEAQTIIRDQTRSTFLEEIIHPFRESIFINGFEPIDAKDEIIIQNIPWKQKIIVKQIESNVYIRLLIGLLTLFIIPVIYKSFEISVKDIKKVLPKIWTFQ